MFNPVQHPLSFFRSKPHNDRRGKNCGSWWYIYILFNLNTSLICKTCCYKVGCVLNWNYSSRPFRFYIHYMTISILFKFQAILTELCPLFTNSSCRICVLLKLNQAYYCTYFSPPQHNRNRWEALCALLMN